MKREALAKAVQASNAGSASGEHKRMPQQATPLKRTPKTSANLNQAQERVNKLSKDREEEERKAKEAAANVRTNSFTFTQLQAAWNIFAQRKEIQSSPIISTITACVYELEGTTIKLFLTNSVQEDQLHRVKPKLLKFLRNELSNDLLQIKAETKREANEQAASSKLYTDADKLQHLIEEYPLFAELKDLLGLDLG